MSKRSGTSYDTIISTFPALPASVPKKPVTVSANPGLKCREQSMPDLTVKPALEMHSLELTRDSADANVYTTFPAKPTKVPVETTQECRAEPTSQLDEKPTPMFDLESELEWTTESVSELLSCILGQNS